MKNIFSKIKNFQRNILFLILKFCNKTFKKIKETYFILIRKFNKYCILLLICASFVTIVLLESFKIIAFNECITNNSSYDVILSAVPCVLTILSITLSISKEKVAGLERSLFNKLRSKFYYNFFEMILISITIFSVYVFLRLFNLSIAVFTLDLISLFLCALFCCEEIPILLKNEKRILKIIIKAQDNYFNKKEDKKEDLNSLISDAQYFCITKYGISKVFYYYKLYSKNDNFEIYLSNYRKSLFEETEFIKTINECSVSKFKDIELYDGIKKTYENVSVLTSKNSNCYLPSLLKNEGRYYVESYLYCLHKLTDFMHVENIEKDNLLSLLNPILYDRNSDNFIYFLCIELICNNIKEGDLWFINAFTEVSFPFNFYTDVTNYFGLFLLILFFYIEKLNEHISNETKQKISNFVDNLTRTSNSFGMNWKQNAVRTIEGGAQTLTSLLPKLLSFYNGVSEIIFTFLSERNFGSYTVDQSTTFTKEILIDSWLELVSEDYNYSDNIKENIAISLDLLDKNDVELVVYRIGCFISEENMDKKFCKYIGITDPYCNKSYMNAFRNIHSKYYKEKTKQHYESLDLPENEELRQKVFEKFQQLISNNAFASEKVNANEDEISFKFRVDRDNALQLINLFFDYNKGLLNSLIGSRLNSIFGKERASFEYQYSKADFDLITNFKPKFYGRGGNLRRASYEFAGKYDLDYKQISEFPLHTFIKENAIKADFKLNKNDTIVRNLNDEEMCNLIDSEYEMTDGLYSYSDYGTKETSYYVTKEELQTILNNKFLIIEVHYNAKIEIDQDGILIFNKM